VTPETDPLLVFTGSEIAASAGNAENAANAAPKAGANRAFTGSAPQRLLLACRHARLAIR
jgi:hypothetical protein